MTATLAAVLGLTLAQPPAPAPDYYPLTGRTIDLPIEYKGDRKGIGQVQLYASADKGQTWPLVATVLPDKTQFSYTAPKDGSYWFHIVIVDRAGKKDPANLTVEPPAMKVLVDTVRPVVEFKSARRTPDDLVVVEWDVRDDHPNDAATKVSFRRAEGPSEDWREVTLPSGPRNGVKFAPGTTGPVQVKVTVADLAGNSGEGLRDIPSVGQTNPIPAGGSPPIIAPPTTALTPAAGVQEPLAPTPPAVLPMPPTPAAVPFSPAPPPPAAPAVNPAPPPAAPAAGGPLTTFDPRTSAVPTAHGAPAAPAAGPAVDLTRAPVLKSLQFDLQYQVDQRGPSGIQRVDLWATRDDGRSWVWWSKHAGNDPTVRVNLGIPSNTQPEGPYGFRLVPVSGAGLSDATPAPGDAPDVRVVVDITPPTVSIFPPSSDATDPTVLVLQWEAVDRNFGEEPIALEWSDNPAGPWRPVVGADGPVVQIGAVGPTTARRVPNTGRYAWRVPAGLPPRVYLKVTARDAAGNATEQVTREPLLIDLTKPRARIIGVGALTPR